MTSRFLIGLFSAPAPAAAQDDLATAPSELPLRVAAGPTGGICRRLEMSDPHLATGAKYFKGVGFVDAENPNPVAFEIDRVSAYQIDSC